jgi:hypothetical protein
MITYAIQARYFVLRDTRERLSPNVRFHVNTGDYFAALATFMGALGDGLRDNILRNEAPQQKYVQLVDDLREDFRSLQKEYLIEPRMCSME